jgi:hypothetical protein
MMYKLRINIIGKCAVLEKPCTADKRNPRQKPRRESRLSESNLESGFGNCGRANQGLLRRRSGALLGDLALELEHAR